jgi:transposase
MARRGAMVYTKIVRPAWLGFAHATVCHLAGEWTRHEDGDGIREVHHNTREGIWTGLRNDPRLFRGVSKHELAQFVAVFPWSYNPKAMTDDFPNVLMAGREYHGSPHMSRYFIGRGLVGAFR